MRRRLSVTILTKNEERRLPRCLESVRWADEVIVVDGVSEDRTAAIARGSGAQVVSRAFSGSFAEERNAGLRAATGDWVLTIDADDVVTPGFRKAVRHFLAEESPHDVMKFRRRSILMGRALRYGGWHYYLPNLVRRGRVWYEGRVHERPVTEGSTGMLEADIDHHPCDDWAAFVARQDRYTTLQAEEIMSRPVPPARREIVRAMRRRPGKTFWKSYVKKQGFREGAAGAVLAGFFAWIELIKWAKCWERLDAPVLVGRRAPEPAAVAGGR